MTKLQKISGSRTRNRPTFIVPIIPETIINGFKVCLNKRDDLVVFIFVGRLFQNLLHLIAEIQ